VEQSRRRRPRPRGAPILVALVLISSLALPVAVRAGSTPFVDIDGSPFRTEIEWLYAQGITRGCTADRFCPGDPLTRGQMAALLVRMFDLPFSPIDAFSDDETSIYEADINNLAASGITAGCTPTTYCPKNLVRRDEMASFLARVIPLTDGGGRNYFQDDDGTTHEADIDRLAAAGMTASCGPWRFCPAEAISREQVAAFLRRVVTPLETPLAFPAPGPVIRHVALAGADEGNDCADAGNPCRTVGRAISQLLYGDTIVVGPGTFHEENLAIGDDTRITGDPGGATVIDATGGAWARIVTVYADADVTLEHLTFRGGRQDEGGAIYSRGTLHIVDSTFIDNRARYNGGAIYGSGTVTVSGSTFTANEASHGGAIKRTPGPGDPPGSLVISGTRFTANVARYAGGAIWSWGAFELTDSILEGNTAGISGGGIDAGNGVQTIRGSTVSGNASRYGGGVRIEGDVTIDRSTIDDNTATTTGGGIYTWCGRMQLVNSTVAHNTAPDASGLMVNCLDLIVRNATITHNVASGATGGAVLSSVASAAPMRFYNTIVAGNVGGDVALTVADSTECCGPVTTASIVGLPAGLTIADILDPVGLADHGGPTDTIALVDDPTNPAIGAGSATVCVAAPVGGIDQRGLPRFGACDIGAYELQP
jgi:predicted outer membrane repeat protein